MMQTAVMNRPAFGNPNAGFDTPSTSQHGDGNKFYEAEASSSKPPATGANQQPLGAAGSRGIVETYHQPRDILNVAGPGRRLRTHVAPNVRRHLDYIAPALTLIQNRLIARSSREKRAAHPHALWGLPDTVPVVAMRNSAIDCVCLKFVRAAVNKWSPEGKRLVTGSSTGEFTLWNGIMFNFETILQAHDTAIRALCWSHNDAWLMSADHDGYIKYWQPNMNNVHAYQAHREPIRALSFCPSDQKFVTGSDDGTVRVWDFASCTEERILRGHGSDVRSVDWHPHKALVVSGSRDSQQPVKLWCPREGKCLATLHEHKNSVMATQWNANGNWLLTAGKDHLLKLYDIRMMKEVCTFRGHKKEVNAVTWHPHHEGLFASGGADGALFYWSVDSPNSALGSIERAHDQNIWTLAWHPLGHVLSSGSNDNSVKFWSRSKPGDSLADFHNQTAALPGAENPQPKSTGQYHNTLSYAQELEQEKERQRKLAEQRKAEAAALAQEQSGSVAPVIPGLGITEDVRSKLESSDAIPGLGSRPGVREDDERRQAYKQPIRRVHKEFEQTWHSTGDERRPTGRMSHLEGPPMVTRSKESLLTPGMRPPQQPSTQWQGPQQGALPPTFNQSPQAPFNQGPPGNYAQSRPPFPNRFPPQPYNDMPPNFNAPPNQPFAPSNYGQGPPEPPRFQPPFVDAPPYGANQRPPFMPPQQKPHYPPPTGGPPRPSTASQPYPGQQPFAQPAPFDSESNADREFFRRDAQPSAAAAPDFQHQQRQESWRQPQMPPVPMSVPSGDIDMRGARRRRQDESIDAPRDPRQRKMEQNADQSQQDQQYSRQQRPYNPKRKWADNYEQQESWR